MCKGTNFVSVFPVLFTLDYWWWAFVYLVRLLFSIWRRNTLDRVFLDYSSLICHKSRIGLYFLCHLYLYPDVAMFEDPSVGGGP